MLSERTIKRIAAKVKQYNGVCALHQQVRPSKLFTAPKCSNWGIDLTDDNVYFYTCVIETSSFWTHALRVSWSAYHGGPEVRKSFLIRAVEGDQQVLFADVRHPTVVGLVPVSQLTGSDLSYCLDLSPQLIKAHSKQCALSQMRWNCRGDRIRRTTPLNHRSMAYQAERQSFPW